MATLKNDLRQTGSTLISLMVGMVISLLTILAALTLYRNVGNTVFGMSTSNNTGTIPSADQDGQLTSGLLRAQIAMQGAGFGIPAAASDTNFLLLSGAALATPPSATSSTSTLSGTAAAINSSGSAGNAVLWQTNPTLGAAANYTCGGLVSDSSTRALYYISVPSGCTALSTQYSTATWNVVTLIRPQLINQAVTFNARNSAIGVSACWPFGSLLQTVSGMPAPVANLRVDIGYQNSTTNSSNTYQTCLANFTS